MFKNYGILPGAISHESPYVLFEMLDSLDEEEEEAVETDEYLKMFYGV